MVPLAVGAEASSAANAAVGISDSARTSAIKVDRNLRFILLISSFSFILQDRSCV